MNCEPLKGMALSLACGDYGSQVDFHIYKDVMGENWPIVTGHFFKSAGIGPELAQFDKYFRTHYERLLSESLEFNKGAKAYIERLISSGKKCGVVSSAATWMVEYILETLDLNGFFDIVITREHVSKHKPDPEAYNLALSQLGVAPESTLIFEDSAAGVKAGIASGCEVIAIKHEFNGKNDLSNAVKIIESFDEMFV